MVRIATPKIKRLATFDVEQGDADEKETFIIVFVL